MDFVMQSLRHFVLHCVAIMIASYILQQKFFETAKFMIPEVYFPHKFLCFAICRIAN